MNRMAEHLCHGILPHSLLLRCRRVTACPTIRSNRPIGHLKHVPLGIQEIARSPAPLDFPNREWYLSGIKTKSE